MIIGSRVGFEPKMIRAQPVAMADPVSAAVSISMEKIGKDSELFSTTSPESSVRTLETTLETQRCYEARIP